MSEMSQGFPNQQGQEIQLKNRLYTGEAQMGDKYVKRGL